MLLRCCQQLGRVHHVGRVVLRAASHRQLAAGGTPPHEEATEWDSGEEPEDQAAIARFRESKRFRRTPGGRVQVQNPQGQWFELKLDAHVPGALLLRSTGDDTVYYLASDALQQIDLSNDCLVGQLFHDGGWTELMQPLLGQLQDGRNRPVRMTGGQFYNALSMLKEAPPSEEVPAGGGKG